MPEEVFFSVPAELEAALEVTVTVEEDEDEEPIVPPFVDMSPEPSPPAAPGQKPLPPPGTLTTLDFAYSVSNALKANKPVSTGDLTLALADAKKEVTDADLLASAQGAAKAQAACDAEERARKALEVSDAPR